MSETERILSINAIDELEDEGEGQGMTQFPPTPGCPGGYDDEVDPQALLIAATFVSDAIYGRLEEHRTDMGSLRYALCPPAPFAPSTDLTSLRVPWPRLYRAYKRGWVQLSWKLFIYVDLFLAFIEPPYTITPPFEGVHHHPPPRGLPSVRHVSYKKDDEAHDTVHDSCRQCLK
jgi:hypothetical protein